MKKLWPFGLIILILLGYSQWRSRRAQLTVSSPTINMEAKSGRTLRFLAFGDYGTGTKEQMAVMNLVEELCQTRSIDALLLLGDNIYMDGVQTIRDPKWKTIIEKPFSKPCISKLPLFPTLGNHDYKGNPDAQIEYSKINKRWNFPSRFYSINYGSLLEIVALDTNVLDLCFDEQSCVLDFLLSRREKSEAKWKIVMGHHPVVSSSSKHPTGLQGRLLKPILCDFDAYFSGHSHHLEHIKPEDCRGEFFISGAGGASLYVPETGLEESYFAKAEYGVLEFSVNQQSLSYRFINVDGKELYQYSNLNIASAKSSTR